ncbi:mechanosensitive ion channel family protein [Protaetiibacter mangrovi]|uniref:Mechanosensitive ion channel family protein n=1 Tax=Protaetiibacter mangrovi TaxID=2970926 RepID=A0ABT1ZCI1_9MICO|nr:mechanosensitive ion channel family protein [Protaetiibacter mangrovi]MCS0498418.1 mechanosensitive ion channel family protein [Protaetiibacter mangrovi]TPX04788.1 mechanosensitive ion channel family protein [Schumannella luteola]
MGILDTPAIGTHTWLEFVLAVAIVAVVAVAATFLLNFVVAAVARRRGWDLAKIGRILRPFLTLLTIIGLWIAMVVTLPEADWRVPLTHLAVILVIAVSAWLLAGIVSFAFEAVRLRYPIDVADNSKARRVRTQLDILHRVAGAVIITIAIGAILLTFPGVSALGASVLASAGVAGVVAGLAAQTTLSNVFAGVQLAFSDAIRVDDVVVVEDEWGRIEEMTLSYVVVRIWDDRRLVLPSTYFTTTPFANWTRHASAITGTVELDVDWSVPISALRARFDEVLSGQKLWDRRASGVQVTEATGGIVRVRLLMTAADSGSLWDLRCIMREAMVEWVREASPRAVPRTRVEMLEE